MNLKSNGELITTYIELPEGYNVSDIDVNSVQLDAHAKLTRALPKNSEVEEKEEF